MRPTPDQCPCSTACLVQPAHFAMQDNHQLRVHKVHTVQLEHKNRPNTCVLRDTTAQKPVSKMPPSACIVVLVLLVRLLA